MILTINDVKKTNGGKGRQINCLIVPIPAVGDTLYDAIGKQVRNIGSVVELTHDKSFIDDTNMFVIKEIDTYCIVSVIDSRLYPYLDKLIKQR